MRWRTVTLHAAAGQAGSRLKAEETAADHHRAAAASGGREHLLDIVEIAEGDDAGQVACQAPGTMNGSEPVAIRSLS